ncbi:MAG: hypothetical protein ACFFAS_02625 [Promethearchaeota archaeon]
MGYAHYWYRKRKDHDLEKWKKFARECEILHQNMPERSTSSGGFHENDPLRLNGCSYYEFPQFTDELVHFNGSNGSRRVFNEKERYWEDETPHDLDYETFRLTRKLDREKKELFRPPTKEMFAFCKTGREVEKFVLPKEI